MARTASVESLLVSESVKDYLAVGPGRALGMKTGGDEGVPVHDPSTAEIIAMVPEASEADIDAAVSKARAQMDGGAWSQTSPYERQQKLLALADLIEKNAEELAQLETVNSGKILWVAEAIEIGASIELLRYMAGWATKITGETLQTSIPPRGDRKFSAYTVREPLGVVGAITPWNFPFMMAMWKVAPALACGNAIVVKPPEDAPLTTIRFAELALEAGIPEGVFNVVCGRGETVGAYLSKHPGIDKLTFTGSTSVGKVIGHEAVERIVPCTLELGGKSPVIVLDDCNPDFAAEGAAAAIFLHQGQTCVAGSRIYVQRKVHDALLDRLTKIAGSMKVGAPMEPGVEVGPVQSQRQLERIIGYVRAGRAAGADILAGGDRIDRAGYYVAPTVVAGARQDSKIIQEEVFGPVVTVTPFDDLDEAVELANDSPYGLASSIWSNDLTRVQKLIPQIKAGTVWINTHAILDPTMPHGGYKASGVGREHGSSLIDHYTQTKTVCMLV